MKLIMISAWSIEFTSESDTLNSFSLLAVSKYVCIVIPYIYQHLFLQNEQSQNYFFIYTVRSLLKNETCLFLFI